MREDTAERLAYLKSLLESTEKHDDDMMHDLVQDALVEFWFDRIAVNFERSDMDDDDESDEPKKKLTHEEHMAALTKCIDESLSHHPSNQELESLSDRESLEYSARKMANESTSRDGRLLGEDEQTPNDEEAGATTVKRHASKRGPDKSR